MDHGLGGDDKNGNIGWLHDGVGRHRRLALGVTVEILKCERAQSTALRRISRSPGKHVSGVVAHNRHVCRRGLCQHLQLQRIDMKLKQRVLVALHRYLRDGARMHRHMCVLGACACACKHGSTILADWTGYTPRSYM